MPERPRFYVDGEIKIPDPQIRGGSFRTVVFGPFLDRAEAERALTAFAGRENALGAVIRDPDA